MSQSRRHSQRRPRRQEASEQFYEGPVTHTKLHLDEVVGLQLLRTFAPEDVRRRAHLPMRFVDAGRTVPPWARRALCIGVGNGPFNEHQEGVFSSLDGSRARNDRVCAATLIADAYNIRQRAPQVRRLLDYVENADSGHGKNLFFLSALMQAAHVASYTDATKYSNAAVLGKALFFCDVHVQAEARMMAPSQQPSSPRPEEGWSPTVAAAQEWARTTLCDLIPPLCAEWRSHCSSERAALICKQLTKLASQARDEKLDHLFDPVGLLTAAYLVSRETAERALGALRFFLEAHLIAQREFHVQAQAELARAPFRQFPSVVFLNNRRFEQLATVALVRDCRSPKTKAYAFSRYAPGDDVVRIVVLRLPSGHVRIFENEGERFNFPELVQLLRSLELRKRGRTTQGLAVRELRSHGTLRECPWWVYPEFREAQFIGNGTETAPHTPVTLLTDEEILEAIRLILSAETLHPSCPQTRCAHEACPIFEARLPRCYEIECRENTTRSAPASVAQLAATNTADDVVH